jgi:hypothetical protein
VWPPGPPGVGTIGRGTRPVPPSTIRGVIQNVVIHISNEQPLLADLYDMPAPADVTLLCTNVRMLDGKKPVFVDRSDSIFVFPYLHIRFLEIRPGSGSGMPAGTETALAVTSETPPDEEVEADLELDEDFLRRIREV